MTNAFLTVDYLQWAIGLWLFCFGACAGSFMNVVIWRLPLGRSVVYPGSRCPNCGHAVRSYDNIPIINWLILRGRCRDCGVGISWRYPAVETLVASLFVLVAVLEPLQQGANLPRFPEASQFNWPGLVSLWILYGIQMLLICTLICSSLMWFDGGRPPEKLYAPVALVALFAPLIWPELRPEQWIEEFVNLSPRVAVATESVIGLLFAGVVAAVTAPTLYPRGERKPPFTPAMWEIAVCTLVFGVTLSARIVASACLMALLGAWVSRLHSPASLIPWPAYLVVCSIIHIAMWKPMTWLVVPVALIATAFLAILTKILARPRTGYIPGWNRDWPVAQKSTPHVEE